MTNALIRTSDPHRPTASTLVVIDGVIDGVGDAGLLTGLEHVPVHDLGGRVVIPGIVDAHTHPGMVSQSAWHTALPWTSDIDELLAFIRDHAARHPVEEAPYLFFEYYPTETFADLAPTKELLDSAVSDRPVLCQDHSEHSAWVNSRMLELMGVTRDTPDPTPGLEVFVRDADGEPTGHIHELAYLRFVERMYDALGWRPPEDLTPERIAPFFRFMTEHGVTALFDALVIDETLLASVAELDRRGDLNMRYSGAFRFNRLADLPEVIERVQRGHAAYGNDRITVNTLKLFLDGTNEIGNSAVLAPLCSHGGAQEHGATAMELAELTDCLTLADAEGVDVHIHLVGDRAFRMACDAVEAARRRAGDGWRIQVTLAHCELVDPADMARPADLGVFINWTMHWSGGYFGEEGRAHLGDPRWDRMYRFNEMADAGAALTFSSDVVTQYELHRGNPFFGMQVARTRVDPEFPLDPVRYPGSIRPEASAALSVDRLLHGCTIEGARQLRLDDRVGSLEPGKVADLVVLSADPVTIEPTQLDSIVCVAVVVSGRLVAGQLPGGGDRPTTISRTGSHG